MSELDDLRNEVRKRQAAANAKVSRLRAKNVEIARTEFDPRRDPAKIGRYNSTQLRNYLGKLNDFTSRTTRFVASQGGQPIPGSYAALVKRDYTKYNAKAKRSYDRVKGYHNPEAGMSVEEFDNNIRADKIQAAGKSSHRPLAPKELDLSRVNGLAGLQALHKDIQRRNRREYLPEELRAQRKRANTMLDVIGVPEYKRMLAQMTDHQFDVMHNYMDMLEEIVPYYLQAKSFGPRDETYEREAEENTDGIKYWLQRGLTEIPRSPRSAPKKPPAKRARRK